MVSGLYLLGLVPLWPCSLAPPGGSDWLLRPERSASTVPGFLATEISCAQIQTTGYSWMQNTDRSSLGSVNGFQSVFVLFLWTDSLVCVFSFKPVLGVFSSFWLVWRRGVLRCSVCVRIGASPTRMRATEGEGSFSAKAIWQQAFLVQIHLWVGTAHLTAHTKTDKLYPQLKPTAISKQWEWDKNPLFPFDVLQFNSYNKLEGKAAKNHLKNSKGTHARTHAVFAVPAAHTSINDI